VARLERITMLAATNTRADTVSSPLSGFSERMRNDMHGGYFITSKAIEQRNFPLPTSLFHGVPGIMVRRVPATPISPPGYRLFGLQKGACQAEVYIDGVHVVPDPGVGVDVDGLIISSTSIAGIEVYPSINRAPPQYQRANGNCAVVLIWTKTR
jgi:hypothetical protein